MFIGKWKAKLIKEYKYWDRDTGYIIDGAYIGGRKIGDSIDNIPDLVTKLKTLIRTTPRIGIDITDTADYSYAWGYKFITWKITWWDAKWFCMWWENANQS